MTTFIELQTEKHTPHSSRRLYYFNPETGTVTTDLTQRKGVATLPDDIGVLINIHGEKYHRTGEGPCFQKEGVFTNQVSFIDLTQDKKQIVYKNGTTSYY